MIDILLKGGEIVDGTGAPRFAADVAVADGRIVDMGRLDGAQAQETVDCRGLCVSPGWVDIHGHADWSVLEHPAAHNLLIQGCTTTLAGNCGMSSAPLFGHSVQLLGNGAFKGNATTAQMEAACGSQGWSMADMLDQIEAHQPGVNYAQLVGHSQIRRCVMGHAESRATAEQISAMQQAVVAAMEQGAVGMSTGLVFIPGCWSDTDEVVALAQVVAQRNGLYASHIRGERETNIEAAQEFVTIAERAGARAQMSHMQSKWPILGNGVLKLDMLQKARDRGVDIACDSEAFPCCPSTAANFLQIYSYTPDELMKMMGTVEGRSTLKHTMHTIDPWHPLGRFGPGGVGYRRAWDRIVIYDCPHDRSLQGKTVAQVAAQRGISFEDALFDLTLAEQGKGPILINDYIEDDHFRTSTWEYCIFPSVDTGLFDPAETLSELQLACWRDVGYPGTIGLFPRVLGQFVRQEHLMTLEEAVRKMTSLAMQRIGISDRGTLRKGNWADLVVFDPTTIALRAQDADPADIETFYPVGIDRVIVNGQTAVVGHTFTGAQAGQVLRHAH